MNSIDLTLENFQSVFIETSKDKLVIIDFWADWCEPCKNLMPILDKLAVEFQDTVTLAKVNCDEQQEIAAQFQIRSLPTVMFVKDGQPVDGFAGVKTESEIRELIQKQLPAPEQALLTEGLALYQSQDYQGAITPLKQALELSTERHDARLILADCYIELKQVAQSKLLLDAIPLVAQDQNYHSVMAKVHLAEQAAETPEIMALEQKLAQSPDDHEIRIALAIQYSQAGKSEQALELLFTVLQRDINFADAKKNYLDILAALPEGEPCGPLYRRKLYSLLY